MSDGGELRASLDELLRQPQQDVDEPDDRDETVLPEGFWDEAVLVMPPSRSVHLKLDPEVFDYFKSQGKGHLTRMQNVLKAYVRAKKRG